MWYHDPQAIAAAIEQHGSIRAAARFHNLHHTTLMKWWRRGDQPETNASNEPDEAPNQQPGARITNTDAVIIGPVGTTKPDELLRRYDLDPDEWDYTPTLNVWESLVDGERVTLSQLKLVCRKRVEALLVAADRPVGWRPQRPRRPAASNVRHVMILPDAHAPLHEPVLTEAAWALAEHLEPAEIVCLGDAADNSPWKRHKANPRTDCTAQEALDATYEWFAALRQAAPNADITILPGNHDWWLLDRVKESLPQLATLTRPGDTSPVIGMRHLLRLDELRIDLIDTIGEYHDSTLSVTDDLVALHGTRTGPHGGAVKEFAVWEGASIIQGHDHKTALVAITKRLADGTEVQRYAISAGTMSRRDLGYNPSRNCSQSFAVITIHEDGRWHPDLALYDPQRNDVTWRDWRYTG